ncbi:MAG: amidohydrolase [bacterium]|nr:amidohydrolase [bacterium]
MTRPLLFTNGIIHTLDSATPSADAVLIGTDGRIAFVGLEHEIGSLPPDTQRIDLAGRTLIPGFNDAHVHIWKLGLLLTVQVDARGAAAPSIEAIQDRFHARAAQVPPGTWLTGRGYNEASLPELRHPTAADLDLAAPAHPVALTRTCGHMIVANSLALRLANITAETPDPPGGVIVRAADGTPTGLLQETAMGLLTRAIPDVGDDTMANAIRAAMTHQLRLGITSATDPLLTPLHMRVYHLLEARGDLTVRVNGLPIRRPDGGTDTLPLPEKYLSDTLRVDCVKFFADGGLSGATAAISQPYKVTGTRGVLRFDDDELFELMLEAHANGFRIATHAIGDVALEQVIRTYERLHAAKPLPLRHRIEHLGLPAEGHLARCRALQVIAVPQTVFLPALGDTYRRYLPDAFFPRCYPVRSMIDAGLTVAFSSDAPVVPDDNPLLGIKAALDRKDPFGEPIAPAEAITAYEALYAYTMGGAIASGDHANRGSISVGKWGDVAILSGDPLTTPADVLPSLRVEQTVVGGRLAWEG